MKFIFLTLMPFMLMAESLSTLYSRVESSNIYKNRSEQIEAQRLSRSASLYSSGWSVGAGLGYADVRDGSDAGAEYQLSIGKDFNLNSDTIDQFIKKNREYAGLKKEIFKSKLKVKIWQLYGNYCITMRALQAKGELSAVYDDISRHIQKGVEYGEFDASKSIMAQLALENLNLQISRLENAVQNYESQIKVLVPFDGQFECQRLRPDIYKLFDPQYSALWPMLEQKVAVDKESLSYSDTSFPKLNLNATYTNEIDTDRYMLNVALPIGYGDKKEAQKASAMHQLASSNYELEAMRNNYRYESSAIKSRLDIYTKYLASTEDSIRESSNVLIAQSKMRFQAGEESFISMLKATETKLQMIESILQLKIERHNAVAKYMYDYAIDPNGVSK